MRQVLTVLAVLTLAAAAASANWLDDFDAYAPGSINGQGGWQGWDNSAAAAGVVSGDQALSPTQSQAIFGGADSVHQYSGYTSGQWTYTAWLYIPSASTGLTYFILLNTYNDLGPYNWSVQLPMDLDTNLLNDDMAGGTENIPLLRDEWVKLQFDIDLDANTVVTWYGATLVSTHAWQDGTGANAIAAVDLYANGAEVVYYDSMSLTPEPAALALLALGVLLRRR